MSDVSIQPFPLLRSIVVLRFLALGLDAINDVHPFCESVVTQYPLTVTQQNAVWERRAIRGTSSTSHLELGLNVHG